MIAKKATSGNPWDKSIIKIINQVLANLIRTFELDKYYVDEDDT